MKYLCLIYDDEKQWETMAPAQRDGIMGEYGAFSQDIAASGHMLGGAQLQPSSTATTVRVRDGRLALTDGPFVETKEQLGGYFIVEARDLNEAIQVAQRIPSAKFGAIEVRPLVPSPDMPPVGAPVGAPAGASVGAASARGAGVA